MPRRTVRCVAALAALTVSATSLVFLSIPAQADPAAVIRITEVEYNGSEFVELTNVGDAAQDFTGWSFDDDSRTPGVVSLAAFGSVAAGESVILSEATADAFRTEWGLASTVKVIGGNLANLGRADEPNIFDGTGALVDRVTYNDQAADGNPAKGPRTDTASAWASEASLGANTFSAWTRSTVGDAESSWTSANGFIGSPGVSTLAPDAPAGTPDIQITEVEYNGSEFVELTNVGTAAQDFTGWSFDDDSRTAGTVSLSGFGMVAAGESVILSESTDTAFRSEWGLKSTVKVIGGNLANLGRADEPNIFDSTGTLVDRVTYNDQAADGNPAKGPRTDTASAWVSAANVGLNTFSTWTRSTVADAEGSWSSAGAFVGSPGASTLGTSTPTSVRDSGGSTPPALLCQPEAASGTGATPSGAEAWPGSSAPVVADNQCAWKTTTGPEGRDISGLIFDKADPSVLWAVKNKSWIFKLVKQGGLWVPATGWENGKQISFPGGTGEPDSEGLTIGPDGALYVTSERDNTANSVPLNSVLRFDPNAVGTTLTATRQWNLTAEFPELASGGANLGFEGVTFVPDSYLTANGFVDQSTGTTYRPSSYPLHGTGLYFAALENDGKLYAYALNSDSTFRRIAAVSTGLSRVMEVQYDADLRRIWAVCDNTCGVTAVLLKVSGTGAFVPEKVYARPASLPVNNFEGFAVTPSSTCVSGVKEVVWGDDSIFGTGSGSAGEGHALFSGTVSCSLGLGSQGVAAPASTGSSSSTPASSSSTTPSTGSTTPTTPTSPTSGIVPSVAVSTPPVFTPPTGSTNPTAPRPVATGVTLVSQAAANRLDDTQAARPPATSIARAPFVDATAGEPFQAVVEGLPNRAEVEVFIVIDKKRAPLAALTTARNGDLTLPALTIAETGTYNVGVELPNGKIRWIKVRIG